MSDTRYNGWVNYETWAANLWIDNDEGTYKEACRMARRADDVGDLACALKSWVESDMLPDLGSSLAADLLGAAVSEIHWHEIAEHYWEDNHEGGGDEEDGDAA